MTQTLVLRNAAQVALFNQIVLPALTKGHWAESTPYGHAEPWTQTEVKAGSENKFGVNFEPVRDNYNLLKKDFVDTIADKGVKILKKETGNAEATVTDLRKELLSMMIAMRTPLGGQPHQFNTGLMGNKTGRPSKEDLEAIVSGAKTKVAKAKSAGGTKKAKAKSTKSAKAKSAPASAAA